MPTFAEQNLPTELNSKFVNQKFKIDALVAALFSLRNYLLEFFEIGLVRKSEITKNNIGI